MKTLFINLLSSLMFFSAAVALADTLPNPIK